MPLRLRRALAGVGIVVLAAITGVLGTGTAAQAFDYTGYIWKLKSTWGGGYALNIGYTQGDVNPGAPAIMWWNRSNDYNNRWAWTSQANGWYLYMNMYTRQCLASTGAAAGLGVVQRPCDGFDDRQRWRYDDGLGSINLNRPIRNRYVDLYSGATRVLTQQYPGEGTPVVMADWQNNYSLQYWSIVYCGKLKPDGTVGSMARDC